MFVCKPNLPVGNVKTVLVNSKEREIIDALKKIGVSVIEIHEKDYLEPQISAHPDMNFLHIGQNKYISYEKILNDSFVFYEESKPINNNYYCCTKLNVVIIGKYCICNKKTCTKNIENIGRELIYVNQGYTKCSTLVIDENSIITGDIGIHETAKKFDINSLFVSNSEIFLSGYSNGFIGGVGGKLSKDILAVSGKLKGLSDCDKIKSFCRNSGVYVEELSGGIIKDIGSLIPIEEI